MLNPNTIPQEGDWFDRRHRFVPSCLKDGDDGLSIQTSLFYFSIFNMAAKNLPKVFFDVAVNGTPKGRMTFKVIMREMIQDEHIINTK